MVLPVPIGDAAQDTDADRVNAWLDGGGDVNDVDKDGYTLLNCCACGSRDDMDILDAHVSLARTLIARGADVNIPENDGRTTPLHNASRGLGEAPLDMVRLLLDDAKANPNARCSDGNTPLKRAIEDTVDADTTLAIVRMLLRSGASLDCERRPSGEIINAEDIIRNYYADSDDDEESSGYSESVIALKALIAGVRKHGTYKRYMRAPHREVLAVRGLAQRGKLRTDHSALSFLAKQGDNGVVWHVLSYWRPDN